MTNSQIYPLPNRQELDIVPASREANLPIGTLLVNAGRLSEDNVQRILDYQKKSDLLFGEAGVAMGLLTDEDVQHALALQFGHAFLAPDSGLGSELVAATEPNSEAVEHLRVLRSQLMLRWFENDARQAALAIVSPGSGEGRSYIAANLAVLFSQLGKRTLLIDADMRKPRQHKIFGLPPRGAGLSAVLSGRAGWDAVHEIKSLPDLWVLPAGAVPPNPQELLARPGFARLIQALRSSYDVILIDTPAAGTFADAGTIAARAGAALMLACRDTTSVPRISKVAEDLRQFGVTIVGAVLNGAGKSS